MYFIFQQSNLEKFTEAEAQRKDRKKFQRVRQKAEDSFIWKFSKNSRVEEKRKWMLGNTEPSSGNVSARSDIKEAQG